MSEILYMKIERNSRVTHADVRLGDVAGLECVNRSVTARLNAMRILRFREQEVKRYVMSVMKVIEMIHELYPQLEIQNLGESEFIVEYDTSVQKNHSNPHQWFYSSGCFPRPARYSHHPHTDASALLSVSDHP